MQLGVLLPAFNDRSDLARTLFSLAHDPQPFDILVVDDGSVPPLTVPAVVGLHQAILAQHPEVALLGGWTRHVVGAMRPLYVTRYPVEWDAIRRRLHYRTAFSHGACTVRASALCAAGAYREDCPLGDDYELFWRLALRFPCANLAQVVVTRVDASRPLTHANRLAMAWSRLRLQGRHFTWRRLDCWLGIGRSLALLAVPVRLRLTMKRIAGTVG